MKNKNNLMKLKYLKAFEDFDMGRFSTSDSDEQEHLNTLNNNVEKTDDECEKCCEECPCGSEGCDCGPNCNCCVVDTESEERPGNEVVRRKVWGDEVIEKKKFNFEKKKENKKSDKKEEKKEDKSSKGLSASQKKLPEGLRKAIEAKNKKK